MKKKLKKSLACLLAALLIFSAVPMSALADEADTPVSVTVETNAEKAAQDTEPDAEPKPETTAEPTATPEASAKPSAEPTAEPSPEATEEPTEPEATAEPTASPTPNPEDEISLLALGDEAVTRYRTVGINGNFSSNYLYGLLSTIFCLKAQAIRPTVCSMVKAESIMELMCSGIISA